jgi:hypothetical protein
MRTKDIQPGWHEVVLERHGRNGHRVTLDTVYIDEVHPAEWDPVRCRSYAAYVVARRFTLGGIHKVNLGVGDVRKPVQPDDEFLVVVKAMEEANA